MWVRCTLTVPGVMNSRRAMASLRRPSLTRRTTSRSAGVRRGQAGPAGGGAFAAAALAGGVGDCVVEGESLAFFLCLGEPVLPEGVPGLAGGAGGRVAVGGEAGGQVLQRLSDRFGGGEQAGGVGETLAGGGEHAEELDAVAGVHPVGAAVPVQGGLADQVLGVGELAPVPGQHFPAEPEAEFSRPNTAPAYYLGHPARLWITAMRPRHSRTTSRYAMQTVTSGEKQTPSGHDGPPTGAAADTRPRDLGRHAVTGHAGALTPGS